MVRAAYHYVILCQKYLLFFEDIDECQLNNGGCAQMCLNDIGHFQCHCVSGYILSGDGLGCDGKNKL